MTDKPKLKQTEVGMIPSDWEVKTLGELVDMSSGTTPSRFNEKNFQGNVCWLSSGELKSHYIYNTKEKISEAAASTMRLYPKGTVVIAMYGLESEGVRGTSSILAKECTISQACMAFTNLRKINNEFFYYWYAANGDEIGTRYAQGTKQQNLSPEVMKNVVIPLPPTIKEQQRIANALSDVDTLINNLEKLIAKKKNIKQGAMQQLLTGKKRLPGFAPIKSTYKQTELGQIPTDWEVKTIKELGVFLGGGTPSTKNESFWKGNIPWISSADLSDDDIEHISMTRFISQEAVNCSATQICPQGTILIIARVGVGKLALSQQKVCTSQDFCNLIPSKENNSKFLAYALLPVMKQMANETQGTSIKGVAADEIKKVQILVPSSKEEQTAIANVLSDMDTEIATLETKFAKYRKLKTGMMQQLLTGKIRLFNAKSETKSAENNRVVPIAFKRAVLAAEIAHRLCAEPTFGHVKMEKMLFLAEKMCELDINSSYHRDAAGPYDNRALRSVDSQLEKQKWFKFIRSDKGNHYIPLEKRGGHSQYFDRYYSECRSVFDNIINTFKTAKTEQCEIVATLYSAWEDFLNHGTNPTDDQIVTEVLTNWNESKKRISKERWIKALSWMKENSFVPRRT
jgi:type I restriction enzyme S subunit